MHKYVCLFLLCAAFLLLGIRAPEKETTAEIAGRYLKHLGWEIEETCIKETVLLPDATNEGWKKYCEMQTASGFPLAAFCGQTVEKCTLRIFNYPDETAVAVYANVFIADKKVIGGDILSPALEGFLHPLCPQKEAKKSFAMHNS